MPFQLPRLYLLVRHSNALLIVIGHQDRFDRKASFRLRPTDASQNGIQAAQRLASPVDADAAEQAVVRRVPLRCPTWIMTDRHPQAPAIGQFLLHLLLPQVRATTVAAARV